MPTQRSTDNEVDPGDTTDFAAKPPMGTVIALLSGFHFLCCGIPIMVASGVSLSSLVPTSNSAGALVALSASAGIIWHLRRRCASCVPASEPVTPSPHHRQVTPAPAQQSPSAGFEV